MRAKKKDFIKKSGNLLDYDIMQKLGDYYICVGDGTRAMNCFEKAASLGPDEPGPYLGLGMVALQNNHLEDAEIAFRVACRLDIRCARAYAGLAMIAQQKGDYQYAYGNFLKCLELDADNLTALLGLFQVSCQMSSFEKIIYYLEIYLEIHPSDTSVMFSLAALYVREDKHDVSRKLLHNVLTLDPANDDAANLLEEIEHSLAGAKQNRTLFTSRNIRATALRTSNEDRHAKSEQYN